MNRSSGQSEGNARHCTDMNGRKRQGRADQGPQYLVQHSGEAIEERNQKPRYPGGDTPQEKLNVGMGQPVMATYSSLLLTEGCRVAVAVGPKEKFGSGEGVCTVLRTPGLRCRMQDMRLHLED